MMTLLFIIEAILIASLVVYVVDIRDEPASIFIWFFIALHVIGSIIVASLYYGN